MSRGLICAVLFSLVPCGNGLEAAFLTLNVPGAIRTFASDISGGRVVGYFYDAAGTSSSSYQSATFDSAFPLSDPELAQQARKLLERPSSLDIPLVKGPFVSLSGSFAKGELVQSMASGGKQQALEWPDLEVTLPPFLAAAGTAMIS